MKEDGAFERAIALLFGQDAMKHVTRECRECWGRGTFCPSFDPGGSDKCEGCEECERCQGTGEEPAP